MKAVSIKETQDLLLNLLKIVDQICSENNLEYWIDGGTLLGVARNNEFIPWDDDVDICLLPKDYLKLIELLKEKYSEKSSSIFFTNTYRPFPHWSYYLADSSILKKGNLPYKLDILCMKAVPNNDKAILKDKSIINFASYFFRFKYKHNYIDPKDKERFLKKTSLIKQRSHFIKTFNSYVEGLDDIKEDSLYSYPYNDIYVTRNREYYSYKDLFPLKKMMFEDMEVLVPNDVNSYLTKLYGETYMTPPDKNQQQPASSVMKRNTLPLFIIKSNIYITFLLKEIKYIIRRILFK
jgi:lipopolysaccharide cholinephosphotransferase